MPYAELDRVRLYYEGAGSGEPELLFVHGWCCDHTAFQPQFDHFSQSRRHLFAASGRSHRRCRPLPPAEVPEQVNAMIERFHAVSL